MNKKRILVLGASSWLGYLLVQKLVNTNAAVGGTVYKSKVSFPESVAVFRLENNKHSHEQIIKSFEPNTIVNFLRGEEDDGFKLHQKIISLSKTLNMHYIYASSVLALDGYSNIDLTESLEAKSVSPYGIFKARCEQELYRSEILWTILRFSSVQGWVGHKPTRNQVFLQKLADNITVHVDRGVQQNRMLATLLIEGILDIIKDKVIGIIHFGSNDSSEEYVFLQKQAQLFGFSKDLVQLVDNNRNVNLIAIPEKMYQLYGNKYKVSERETLEGLLKIESLKAFKISN